MLLETGAVDEISLGLDLGDDVRRTGYDVVLWIEEAVALRGFRPPKPTYILRTVQRAQNERQRARNRTSRAQAP